MRYSFERGGALRDDHLILSRVRLRSRKVQAPTANRVEMKNAAPAGAAFAGANGQAQTALVYFGSTSGLRRKH